MQIKKDGMMVELLEVCPSFRKTYAEFLSEWEKESDGLPLYLVLADFARHLIQMLERKDTSQFRIIFQKIEYLILNGDDYVSEAIIVGLLEDMQNGNLHCKNTEVEDFRPFLLPHSEKWWNKLYRFWEEGELLIDD